MSPSITPYGASFFDPRILRAYDIRGTFGETLTNETAIILGRQFGAWMKAHHKSTIVVCSDGRLSSPSLKKALIQGLEEQDIDVTDVGVGPTPMLYFALEHLTLDAGIMVTGSHNPKDDNGFKIALSDRPFYGEDIQSLNRVILNPETNQPFSIMEPLTNLEPNKTPIEDLPSDEHLYHAGHISVVTAYLKELMSQIQLSNTLLRIAIDCGNGATGDLITRLVKKFPPHIHVQLMYEAIDGNFPNHHPDPADPQNLETLIQRVKKEKLDLGIAFDGDGDRLGVVDRYGNVIKGDQLTLFFAVSVLKSHTGAAIMADVKSSQLVFEAIEASGGQALMCPTGHSNFKALMPRHHALFGGEMSGHYFFKDRYFGYDDGIYAMLRLLELTTLGYDVGQFLSLLPKFQSSPDIKIPCPDDEKFKIIDQIKRFVKKKNLPCVDIDGIRVSLDGGWWIIRASNTSAYLTLRYESYFENNLHDIHNHVMNTLEEAAPEIMWDF